MGGGGQVEGKGIFWGGGVKVCSDICRIEVSLEGDN